MRSSPFLLAATLLAACLAPTDDAGVPAEFGPRVSVVVPGVANTLAREAFSGLAAPARSVIADDAAWNEAWGAIYRNLTPGPAMPAVDFATERVILAGLGTRSSGGYEVAIDSVVLHEAGSVAWVTSRAPGAGCVTTAALTAPVHAVRLDRPVEPVHFAERAVVVECR